MTTTNSFDSLRKANSFCVEVDTEQTPAKITITHTGHAPIKAIATLIADHAGEEPNYYMSRDKIILDIYAPLDLIQEYIIKGLINPLMNNLGYSRSQEGIYVFTGMKEIMKVSSFAIVAIEKEASTSSVCYDYKLFRCNYSSPVCPDLDLDQSNNRGKISARRFGKSSSEILIKSGCDDSTVYQLDEGKYHVAMFTENRPSTVYELNVQQEFTILLDDDRIRLYFDGPINITLIELLKSTDGLMTQVEYDPQAFTINPNPSQFNIGEVTKEIISDYIHSGWVITNNYQDRCGFDLRRDESLREMLSLEEALTIISEYSPPEPPSLGEALVSLFGGFLSAVVTEDSDKTDIVAK
jgi:hypothetical protein